MLDKARGSQAAPRGSHRPATIELWLENHAKLKIRPSTYQTYQGFLKNHIKPSIEDILLPKLTAMELQKLYKTLLENGRVDRIEAKSKPKGLSSKTVRNIHQMISSALDFAREQRLISANPASSCALPRLERREMKTIPQDALNGFFGEAKRSGVYELYYIDLVTGLRRGELLGHYSAGFTLDTYAHVTTAAQKQAANTIGNILSPAVP